VIVLNVPTNLQLNYFRKMCVMSQIKMAKFDVTNSYFNFLRLNSNKVVSFPFLLNFFILH